RLRRHRYKGLWTIQLLTDVFSLLLPSQERLRVVLQRPLSRLQFHLVKLEFGQGVVGSHRNLIRYGVLFYYRREADDSLHYQLGIDRWFRSFIIATSLIGVNTDIAATQERFCLVAEMSEVLPNVKTRFRSV